MKKVKISGLAVGLAYMVAVCAAMAESKYATGGTSAAVGFGPGQGVSSVKAIYAKTKLSVPGTVQGSLDIYARSGNHDYYVSAAQAAGTHIPTVNTNDVIGAGTNVLICYATGFVDYRTVSAQNATSLTITAASTYAMTVNDVIQPVTVDYSITLDNTDITDGGITNQTFKSAGDVVYMSPAHSGVYMVLTGSNAVLSATVIK
jgi:hypothetical protein